MKCPRCGKREHKVFGDYQSVRLVHLLDDYGVDTRDKLRRFLSTHPRGCGQTTMNEAWHLYRDLTGEVIRCPRLKNNPDDMHPDIPDPQDIIDAVEDSARTITKTMCEPWGSLPGVPPC